jgi:hypothetical protein
MRFSMGKVPLTAAIKQLREQLQETQPMQAQPKKNSPPPSSSTTSKLDPDYSTNRLQPIHGYGYYTNSTISTKLVPRYDAGRLPPRRIATKRPNRAQT